MSSAAAAIIPIPFSSYQHLNVTGLLLTFQDSNYILVQAYLKGVNWLTLNAALG